jgi:23S rRNA (uracil1939-C5)-methyltransferase
MKKGSVLENLLIENMAAGGRCVTRYGGKVIFVKHAAPGDVVDVEVTRNRGSYAEARIIRMIHPSPHRVEPFCHHFGYCGGCSWQHVRYEMQLEHKLQQVVDSLKRIGGLRFPAPSSILPSARTQHYRNRLDFAASDRRWLTESEFRLRQEQTAEVEEPALGFHVPGRFDQVFDVEHCWLQPEPSNAIRLALKELALQHRIPFYNLREQTGYLRTVTIRTASTGDVMVIVQVADDQPEWLSVLMKGLEIRFPEITSLHYVINTKKNNTFQDLPVYLWSGKPYIIEEMRRPDDGVTLTFRVGPKSFYQTNSAQAEVLYRAVWDMARLTGHERVYDLYTGTGTIACYVASGASQIIGLEYVAEAVEDARINAQLNGIHHARFFSGDMKELLTPVFIQTHGRPDVVITDPPRAGMHEDVCRTLMEVAPPCIVYVSCNPATQARDLKILSEAYEIEAVQPVDMFPHTVHVENVVRLIRKV